MRERAAQTFNTEVWVRAALTQPSKLPVLRCPLPQAGEGKNGNRLPVRQRIA